MRPGCVALLWVASVAALRLRNPAVDRYDELTQQYARDAVDAKRETERMLKLAEEALPAAVKAAGADAPKFAQTLGVGSWVHADWQFARMLHSPKPKAAAKAAADASKPFTDAIGAYTKLQNQYDAASQGYALRAKMDAGLAQQLQTMAQQYKLEHDQPMADAYQGQATALMKQSENFAKVSATDHRMAQKIYGVIPQIQKEAGQAAVYAAYFKNPTGDLPPEQLIHFTPAPPLPR